MVNILSKVESQLADLNKEHSCPNCGSQGLHSFYEVKNVPVHSCLMMDSREKAL